MSDDKCDILDYKFTSVDLNGEITIREYFKTLLKTLWEEGEQFSGKRVFWQYEIYGALIRGGYVPGGIDEDGYVDEIDNRQADRFVLEHIIARL